VDPPVSIVSPHLDDAVLSCWHLLAGPGDVRVINLFTGVPEGGLGAWDRRTGSQDSTQRMRERLAEDRAALRATGRPALNVGLLDHQYRDGGAPSVALERLVDPRGVVYVPVAFGGHPDHVAARDAGLALREEGVDVRLYADLPHAAAAGWPRWLTGPAGRPMLRPDGGWRPALGDAGIDPDAATAEVRRLDAAAFGRKLGALHCYVTQLPALVDFAPLEALRLEVTWIP
jgi:LmbE family N-acetylglucosaminyl deacetylase